MNENRRKSKQISVGKLKMGGDAPISIQSMLNTPAEDFEKSVEQAKRLEAYQKAQELIVQDAPWIFLQEGENLTAARNNVQGLVSSPSGRYQLNKVSFGEAAQ